MEVISTLLDLCKNKVIQQTTGEHLLHILDSVNNDQKYILSTILPLHMPLSISLPQTLHDEYWRRKCADIEVPYVSFWLCGGNWRNTFITHSVEAILNNFISNKLSFSEAKLSLSCFHPHLRTLKINGFKHAHSQTNGDDICGSRNSLGDSLLNLISDFCNIEDIHFYNFPFGNGLQARDSIESEDQKHGMFTKTICSMKRLKKASLIGTQLDSDIFPVIVKSLIQVEMLCYLNLSCNLITDDFCDAIAEILTLTNIETLLLSNNKISVIGVAKISAALRENKMLHVLHLDSNLIGDEGAIELFQSCSSNTALLKLCSSYNGIGSDIVPSLCSLLLRNETLQYLDISGNYLGTDSGKKIYEATKENDTLSFLGFQLCGFDKESEDCIHLHLAKNHQFNNKWIQ